MLMKLWDETRKFPLPDKVSTAAASSAALRRKCSTTAVLRKNGRSAAVQRKRKKRGEEKGRERERIPTEQRNIFAALCFSSSALPLSLFPAPQRSTTRGTEQHAHTQYSAGGGGGGKGKPRESARKRGAVFRQLERAPRAFFPAPAQRRPLSPPPLSRQKARAGGGSVQTAAAPCTEEAPGRAAAGAGRRGGRAGGRA